MTAAMIPPTTDPEFELGMGLGVPDLVGEGGMGVMVLRFVSLFDIMFGMGVPITFVIFVMFVEFTIGVIVIVSLIIVSFPIAPLSMVELV
eukprot:CAMPEP_0184680448 /NCGR_PEP_ID=MMETSP0312-20130426/3325_1 /TAXON_ID=31354 /ORGANISM="Compsopogon coeruleus, Strain SAG 36.94" /LENGTH=89 /DNA_ID=CAMNT_0027130557 /DNA_START=589 /DNA_END=858 /DNA_ORIENTATION=-